MLEARSSFTAMSGIQLHDVDACETPTFSDQTSPPCMVFFWRELQRKPASKEIRDRAEGVITVVTSFHARHARLLPALRTGISDDHQLGRLPSPIPPYPEL